MAAAKKKELSFEQAKAELEAIVEKLGGGSLPLDEVVKLYEQGVELSAYCKKLLDAYEARLMRVDELDQPDQAEEAL